MKKLFAKKKLFPSIKEMVRSVNTIVRENLSLKEALDSLRQIEIKDRVIYIYVVDKEGFLLGVVPMRSIVLFPQHLLISEIMDKSVTSVTADQTVEEAMELFSKKKLLALPVVDSNGKLLGAIDVDCCLEENFDLANTQHRADIFQLIGLSLQEEKKRGLWINYRLRMPWIFCSIVGGIICAIISKFYAAILSQVVMIAMFIPLVLTLSESVSMQSMTHSLQFLHRPRLSWRYCIKHSIKEWKIIVIIAISSALVVGALSLLWGEGGFPSLAIGFAILVSTGFSASFGLLFPIFLHKMQLDPKVASGPVVLMLADVLTTFFYLTLATLLIL